LGCLTKLRKLVILRPLSFTSFAIYTNLFVFVKAFFTYKSSANFARMFCYCFFADLTRFEYFHFRSLFDLSYL
jgi:hypothetical protein